MSYKPHRRLKGLGIFMEQVPAAATIACPYCAEAVNPTAKKCRHCGEILDPQMREIEMLKSNRNSPNVYMNAGGAATSASAASSSGADTGLRRFPHWIHIILVLISGFLWLPVYLLMYWFRNKRYYY
ncbi:MAG: hypothetical protein ABTQ30_14440 [Rhizobiaceae bacterium]